MGNIEDVCTQTSHMAVRISFWVLVVGWGWLVVEVALGESGGEGSKHVHIS